MSSFDPFEARMQFLQLLRKLNASQASIQKVVGYAIKYGSRCGEDLWECVVEECAKGSLNTRINLLYLLDALLETSLQLPITDAPYPPLISSSLSSIVGNVVPDGEGVLNYKAARQILESWRLRRLVDPSVVDEALQLLDQRRGTESPKKRSRTEAFSKTDILRRMEEDRERHKRLRERIWILPIPPLVPTTAAGRPLKPSPSSSSISPFTPASPSSRSSRKANPGHAAVSSSSTTATSTSTTTTTSTSLPAGQMAPPPLPDKEKSAADPVAPNIPINALDVEFEQLWEGCSDLDADDLEVMREDSSLLASLSTG